MKIKVHFYRVRDNHGNEVVGSVSETSETIQVCGLIGEKSGDQAYFESEAYHLSAWANEEGLDVVFREVDVDVQFDKPSRESNILRGSNIPRTAHHGAGAIAQCSYCGRYTDHPKALSYDPRGIESPKDLRCDCGKTRGWCGSFLPPDENSLWSGSEWTRLV